MSPFRWVLSSILPWVCPAKVNIFSDPSKKSLRLPVIQVSRSCSASGNPLVDGKFPDLLHRRVGVYLSAGKLSRLRAVRYPGLSVLVLTMLKRPDQLFPLSRNTRTLCPGLRSNFVDGGKRSFNADLIRSYDEIVSISLRDILMTSIRILWSRWLQIPSGNVGRGPKTNMDGI